MKLNYPLVWIHCLILFYCTTSFAQTKTIQNLFFSTTDFKKQKITPNDYSDNFTLNKDIFLNIHFNLEQPLIKSLKTITPHLNEKELLKQGNFQFTFLVDGKTIHVENLNKGAGTTNSKTKQLNHIIPLLYPEKLDFWGWFMWLKFMKLSGGQDAFAQTQHNLSIVIRPYIKEKEIKIGSVIAKGSIPVTVAPIKIDESLVSVQKIQPNSGWKLAKTNFNTTKIKALNRKIAEGRFEDIKGIVIIKENKLLVEEYFNGAHRNSLHDARSVGKSFASTILGIAIKDKHIKNEKVLLKNFYDLKKFKNYSRKKDSITLVSLLTMSSGFYGDDSDFSSPGNEENMYPTNNWVNFALNLPMQANKQIGKDFSYFTAGVVVLGDIIHRTVPNGLVNYADNKLFKPLNINNYKWEYTPQGVGNTAGGIRLRAIDFAKYGQLYKNNGEWNGKQILPENWVQQSLIKQVSLENIGIANSGYGYLFWNKVYKLNNKKYTAALCSGNGGNKIVIFKSLPLVIVITASAYNAPNAHANSEKIIKDYLLPAVLDN